MNVIRHAKYSDQFLILISYNASCILMKFFPKITTNNIFLAFYGKYYVDVYL